MSLSSFSCLFYFPLCRIKLTKPFCALHATRPTIDAAHMRSSSYGGSPAAPHDQSHSSSVYGGGAPNASAGANGQDGFGSNRFVTRLD